MRILLIPPIFHYKDAFPTLLSMSDFPSGFAYVASALEKVGHKVYGLNLNNKLGFKTGYDLASDKISKAIDKVKPDLIGLGGLCTDYHFIRDAMEIIKKSSSIPIVLGGGIISNDREIYDILKPDYAVMGEAETAVIKIANGECGKGIVEGCAENLDDLPFPDYEPFGVREMIDDYSMATRLLYRYSRQYPRPYNIVTARSCPFRCLPSSEQVLLGDGTTKSIADIKIGDIVASLSPKGNLVNSCVSTTRQTPTRYDILELVTKKGKLRCTSDHRILTRRGWLEAGKLKVGDLIGQTRYAYKVREGNRSNQTTDAYPQSYERPYYQRESKESNISQYRGIRENATENVYQQPYETTRCQSKSKCQTQVTERGIVKQDEEDLGRWADSTFPDDTRGSAKIKFKNETEQSYVQSRNQEEGNNNIEMETILRPKGISRTMVQEKNWSKQNRVTTREYLNSNGIPFCRRWSVLDWTVPEWEMSQPRFYLEEWKKQGGITFQLNILAQSSKLQRPRSIIGLRESGLEDICYYRTDVKRPTIFESQSFSMVEWVQISEIRQSQPEPVYDIETLPYHNFVASGFIVHNCSFCINESHKRNPYRARSMDNIFAEIKESYEQYKYNILIILDELFVANKKRMREFCVRLIEEKKANGWDFDWMFQTHANAHLDLESLKLAKEAGCYFFSYGLESCSQKILDSMNKKTKVAQAIEAVKLAEQAHVGFGGNIIFGDPAETEETISESLSVWYEHFRSAMVFLSFVQSYPDSKIFDYCVEKGIVTDKQYYYEHINEGLFNMTSMPDDILSKWMSLINIMEHSWLQVKTSYGTCEEDKEAPEVKYLAETGTTMYKIKTICPYCGEGIIYRQAFGDKDKERGIGTGCVKCNKRIKVLVR